MQACRHGANYGVCKKIRKSMSPKQMKDFSYTSHMPKGATQSPKGDLGERRVKECDSQRGLMNHGSYLSAAEAFGSHVGEPGKLGSADYGTKATHD